LKIFRKISEKFPENSEKFPKNFQKKSKKIRIFSKSRWHKWVTKRKKVKKFM